MTFHHRFLKVPIGRNCFFIHFPRYLWKAMIQFQASYVIRKQFSSIFISVVPVQVPSASFEKSNLKVYSVSFHFPRNKISIFMGSGILEKSEPVYYVPLKRKFVRFFGKVRGDFKIYGIKFQHVIWGFLKNNCRIFMKLPSLLAKKKDEFHIRRKPCLGGRTYCSCPIKRMWFEFTTTILY